MIFSTNPSGSPGFGYQSNLPSPADASDNIREPVKELETSHFFAGSFLWGIHMRSMAFFFAALACAGMAFAKQPKVYQTGKILEMDPVQCDTSEKVAPSFAGQFFGTDSGSNKTRDLLCQEYLLEAEHVIYRIRPRDEKHALRLPIGQKAQFRIQKDKLLLRIEDLDGKEHEYIVVSMSLRLDGDAADAAPALVNHLR